MNIQCNHDKNPNFFMIEGALLVKSGTIPLSHNTLNAENCMFCVFCINNITLVFTKQCIMRRMADLSLLGSSMHFSLEIH